MAKKRNKKYIPILIMVLIFIVSFSATIAIGKLYNAGTTLPFEGTVNISSDTVSIPTTDTTTDTVSDTEDISSDVSSDNEEYIETASIPDDEQPEELTLSLSKAEISYNDIKGTQLIVVSTRSVYATIECWEKQSTGEWKLIHTFNDGFIGYWGISYTPGPSDKFTPAGLFDIGDAFGFEDSIDTKLDYFKIEENSYWVTDTLSSKYNTYVVDPESTDWNTAISMDDDNSHRYGAVIKETGAMAGVFLCCGSQCTDRDIVLPEENLIEILKWLNKAGRPQILIY